MKAACGGDLEWRNCYSGQYDLWTPESFQHPAKMAPGLAFKILMHLEELGLLQPGMTVLDPLCGIGTSLLVAAIRGYRAVGVELEEKFVSLARQNAERIALKGFGAPIEIIQGDARHLSALLAEKGMVSVTSPPFLDTVQVPRFALTGKYLDDYIRQFNAKWGKGRLSKEIYLANLAKEQERLKNGYGTTEGQIGVLPDVAITSPPYAGHPSQSNSEKHPDIPQGSPWTRQYPHNEGQLADLPDTVTVTSPPYEDQLEAKEGREWLAEHSLELGRRGRAAQTTLAKIYGISEGQIGQEHQESYLDAMRLVYAEIAKVSPVLVVVVKDPTRNGKLRLLGEDTVRLMEAAGYKIICRHRAILFEEQEQGHLFDGSVKQPKGRLGFFKRLAYRKGLEIASYEHILFGLKV